MIKEIMNFNFIIFIYLIKINHNIENFFNEIGFYKRQRNIEAIKT
jgi:hypothetical protein